MIFRQRLNMPQSNIRLQTWRTFPWLRMREQKGELSVHGAWFDIGLGELHSFDETERQWALIDTL
jgi:carbonic anhydrase